ncbi:hypothetical protein Taro_001089 [Colocasia esculenta]|uniref:Uncharacterized protein n=1 Tax=Colocasia esculenta TaxID=4460 RepID=A0A843TH18_COLES|nr:hypothetical protein [Colocasia esculenta]
MAGPNTLMGLAGPGGEAKEEENSWGEGFIRLHPEFFKLKSYWALSLTLRYLLFVSQELEEMASEHAQMHELQQTVQGQASKVYEELWCSSQLED